MTLVYLQIYISRTCQIFKRNYVLRVYKLIICILIYYKFKLHASHNSTVEFQSTQYNLCVMAVYV